MSAPVRSSPHRWIFFVCPETVVILHREQTRPEAVMEDFRNFGQRFSAADFSHRQMGPFACRVATQRFA